MDKKTFEYDFCGWATKADLKCSDGRIIQKNSFKHQDGMIVPLVWNHQHNEPWNVLGHALLEAREDGMYAYCSFNDTEGAMNAKMAVEHGDVKSLSIHANQLKQTGPYVNHGMIREVSIVLAGANPGAFIENVISHADGGGEGLNICYDEPIAFEEELEHAEEGKDSDSEGPITAEDVEKFISGLSPKDEKIFYAVVGKALETAPEAEDKKEEPKKEETKPEVKHSEEETNTEDPEGGNESMKSNVFDQGTVNEKNTLTHADQQAILELAQTKSVGSFQEAFRMYCEEHKDELKHGFEDYTVLFPEFKDAVPGVPETLTRDYTWVGHVINSVKRSPITRVRTRKFDARQLEGAKGHKKGEKKTNIGNIKLLNRTTDPQTIYLKDELHRDDILDITEFDTVAYTYKQMEDLLKEKIALCMFIGDGKEDGDPDKVYEDKIRPILTDDELFVIHTDVDIEAAKAELQGSNTGANFGENYIYAEAIITASLYAREQYKGKGGLDFYCTPHLVNVMLLARDLNGRRIYNDVTDLAKALNVKNIYTVEQFEGVQRTTKEGAKKDLLGFFVNINTDYQLGAAKGGNITKFDQFDIDYNNQKLLLETRLSGALINVKSAIVLEMPVTA